MKRQKISIYDFQFVKTGYGRYSVAYQSPVTLKIWVNETDDMCIIDATKNEDKPKVKDLEQLKRLCKEGRLTTKRRWWL